MYTTADRVRADRGGALARFPRTGRLVKVHTHAHNYIIIIVVALNIIIYYYYYYTILKRTLCLPAPTVVDTIRTSYYNIVHNIKRIHRYNICLAYVFCTLGTRRASRAAECYRGEASAIAALPCCGLAV